MEKRSASPPHGYGPFDYVSTMYGVLVYRFIKYQLIRATRLGVYQSAEPFSKTARIV